MKAWNELSYKRKNQLLWLAGLLFLFVAYQLAFSKTIIAYKNYRHYKNSSEQAGQIEADRALLKTRLQKLRQTFDTGTDTLQFRDEMLSAISEFAAGNNLLVTSVPESAAIVSEGDLAIVYASFFIEGGFIDLLRLTEEIEKKITSARISSVSFSLKDDKFGSQPAVILHLRISKVRELPAGATTMVE